MAKYILDFSGKRVRCNGKALDKCSLSNHVHAPYICYSHIYWYTCIYADIVAELRDMIRKYPHLYSEYEFIAL